MSLHSWLTTWRQAYLLLATAALAVAAMRGAGLSGGQWAPGAPAWSLALGALLLLGGPLGSLCRGARAQRVIEFVTLPVTLVLLFLAYAGQSPERQALAWWGLGLLGYLSVLHLSSQAPRELATGDPATWWVIQLAAVLAGLWLAEGLLGPASVGVNSAVAVQRLIYILGLLGVLSLLTQLGLLELALESQNIPNHRVHEASLGLAGNIAVFTFAVGFTAIVLSLRGEGISASLHRVIITCFLGGMLVGATLLAACFSGMAARGELMPVGFIMVVAALAMQIPLTFGSMESLTAFFLLGEGTTFLILPAMSTTLRVSSGPSINWRSLWVWLAAGAGLLLAGALAISFDMFGSDFTLSTRFILTVLAILPLGFASMFLFREAIVAVAKFFFGTFMYRVRTYGRDNLPEGGFLLIPNHVTWVDSIILHLACPRPMRFLIHDSIYRLPWLNPIMRLMGAVPISNTKAREGLRIAGELVKAGEIVCIFPEGSLSRSGQLMKLRKGFELIARQADCPVVPVWMDRLWGSIFSFRGGKFFFKMPEKVPYPVTVKFGKAISPQEVSDELVRERLLKLSADCYNERSILKRHIGREAIAGLKSCQFRVLITDGMDGSTMKAGTLLAAGIALSRKLKKDLKAKRVGIVLPPGKGGMIANLAVMLANKVPVNLNFTAGRAALESAIKRAEITDMITALMVQKKVEDVPWTESLLHLDRLVPELKKDVILWRIAVLLLPSGVIASMLGLPKEGGAEEGTILFTSGSSGEPKGVVLSHRNILGNVEQFDEVLDLRKDEQILGSLPIFHSFGCTVTLWWPLVKGQPVVTYPSPLDVPKNAELIEKYQIKLMVATPTFLRGYLRRAKPEQLASLSLIVSGAEKLPMDLRDNFKEKFGADILEGYGLTETSPVVSVNMPDRKPARAGTDTQVRLRPGSVGRPMPGLAVEVRDPDTGENMSLYQTGMLWFYGANIFDGYLNDPERTAEVIENGWFKSGDLGRMDDDGFLFIEGRLSRFSKIAGEMVPHATVESKIIEVLGLQGEDQQPVVVMGVPDEAKGEALVLLSTKDLDMGDIRKKLNEAGIANLWVPKQLKKIDAVPLLASGKLDLKKCQALAKEGGSAPAEQPNEGQPKPEPAAEAQPNTAEQPGSA